MQVVQERPHKYEVLEDGVLLLVWLRPTKVFKTKLFDAKGRPIFHIEGTLTIQVLKEAKPPQLRVYSLALSTPLEASAARA